MFKDTKCFRFTETVDRFGQTRMQNEIEELRRATSIISKECKFQQKNFTDLNGENRPSTNRVIVLYVFYIY